MKLELYKVEWANELAMIEQINYINKQIILLRTSLTV